MHRNRRRDDSDDDRPHRRHNSDKAKRRPKSPVDDDSEDEVFSRRPRDSPVHGKERPPRKAKGSNRKRSPTPSSDSEEEEEVQKPRRRQRNVKPKFNRDEVIAGILEFICNKKRFCASWDEVSSHLSVPTNKLKEIVFEFHLIKDTGSTIRLDMDVTLCHEFIESPRGCLRQDCGNLHICPKFIHSTCHLDECDLGHSFTTRHNGDVLQRFGIRSFPTNVLLLVFAHLCDEFKDPGQLPDFCDDYNSQRCSSGDACSKFHICEKFIMSDDEVLCDGSCNLNHKTLKANVKSLLEAADIDTNLAEKELVLEFRKLMKQKLEKKGIQKGEATTSGTKNKTSSNSGKGQAQSSSSSSSKPQAGPTSSAPAVADDDGDVTKLKVCLKFLHRKCSKPCGALHSNRPYQWQVKSDTSSKAQWFNFCADHNIRLENAFCDPGLTSETVDYLDPSRVKGNFSNIFSLLGFNGSSLSTWTADFEQMILTDVGNTRNLDIRRLSTPSSVVSTDQWATIWQWYFIDRHQKWVEYGASTPDDANTNYQSDITSADIETAYDAHLNGNGNPVIPFKTGGYNYEIQFTKTPMQQQNMGPKYFTAREVRRRPKPFVSLP